MTSETGWIQTFTGRAFFPLDPDINAIDIIDIAWSLSMQCRYAGHTKSFYSVAEHCVHISNAVPPEAALWGLLHDAPECYLVDLPSPVKQGIPEYRVYEARLMRVIAERFGLLMPEPLIVKEYDRRILHNERRDLMQYGVLDWNLVGEPIPDLEIQAWTPAESYDRFMSQFLHLTGDCPLAANQA